MIAACLVDGLITRPPGDASVAMRLQGGNVTFTVSPARLAKDPAWLTVTAWQACTSTACGAPARPRSPRRRRCPCAATGSR